jgi:hypothetical protein
MMPEEVAMESGRTRQPVGKESIPQLAAVAGVEIPPERVAGARERLDDMLRFLDELATLEIEDEPPAVPFDPGWGNGFRS